MYRSREYRDTLAQSIKETPKDERKGFLEGEKTTPEYEVADLLKNYDALWEAASVALKNWEQEERSLNREVSPTSVEASDLSPQGRENLGFQMSDKIDSERFHTMFRVMLDPTRQLNFARMYAKVDEAREKYDKAAQLKEEAEKAMDDKIEELGGIEKVKQLLGLRSNLLDAYIESVKKTKEAEARLRPEQPVESEELKA